MKYCSGCETKKPISEFYSNRARYDGLSGLCRVCHGVQGKLYVENLRNKAFIKLGDKCIVCGFSDRRALQFDHVNGGGVEDRKGRGPQGLFIDVLEDTTGKYQLLCANHNAIKRVENGEFRKNGYFEQVQQNILERNFLKIIAKAEVTL